MRLPTFFILAALMDGPLHGYGIIKRAGGLSDGEVQLAAGTLYGALDRLEQQGLVEAGAEEVVDGRARRYYRLTAAGQAALDEEAERLHQAAAVVRGARPAAGGQPA